MIAIVKIKMKYERAQNATVVWVYNSISESQHKGSQVGNLGRTGYRIMRRGKEADQYAIDLGFKGEKDKTYITIEKEIKPLVRERVLTDLLEN